MGQHGHGQLPMEANLPPHDADAEKALLGCLMLSPDARREVPELRPEHFYVEANQRILASILGLVENGTPADLVTVGADLDRRGWFDEVGGVFYLQDIAETVQHIAHVRHYFDIVYEKYRRRRLQLKCREAILKADDPGADFETMVASLDMGDIIDATDNGYELITADELANGDYQTEYHIPGILAAGQPGGIFGAFKTLKTLIAVDMWISLATGFPFLGMFRCDQSIVQSNGIPVGLMSGESGVSTLQDAAKRICKQKGTRLEHSDKLFLSTDLPNLGEPIHSRKLERFIVDNGLKALILDPTYLCMPGIGDDAGNLFKVGKFLQPLSHIGRETGCTIVIVHHCGKRTNTTFEPAELADVQWSGFAEWVRQWVLLSRRSKYEADSDGKHELWLNVGGSAGHSGLWAVDITEGRADSEAGRRWGIEINYASKARAQAAAEARESRKKAKEQEKQETERREREKLVEAMRLFPDGETSRVLKDSVGLNDSRFKRAIAGLLRDKIAVLAMITKACRKAPYEGYKLSKTTQCEPMGQAGQGDGTRCPTDGTTDGTRVPRGDPVPLVPVVPDEGLNDGLSHRPSSESG